ENFGRLPETPLTIYGECAAKFAGPLGVGEIAEAFDDYRVLALQHLGRHGAVSPAHRHRRGTVDTVTIGPATPAAEEHIHERQVAAVLAPANEMEHVSAFTDRTKLAGQGFGH